MKKIRLSYVEQGFSVVEIIMAAALFLVFSGGIIFVILQGLDANRLGEEETIATQYASEGLEAVRSIRNQSYSNLATSSGTGIIRSPSNVWAFSGTSSAFGKYTRVITVSDVQRDGSGNIVASGGTVDPETRKITSTVFWDTSSTRNNSIILSLYLTNWKAINTPTPTLTPTATPTPTVILTCASYCSSLGGYTTGICRQNAQQCRRNGEIHESGGDVYCTGGASADTCCCQ